MALLSEEKGKKSLEEVEVSKETKGRKETEDKLMEFDFSNEEVVLFEQPVWYKEYLLHILLGVLIVAVLLTRAFFFNVFIISGESMEPTMENHELALIDKISNPESYERGDVIIFKGEKRYVKRIIALSGETLSIKDNQVYVNGEPLEETYLDMDTYYFMSDLEELVVPENSFFVMGDNRGNSMDSRNGLGLPTYEDIIGKVITHGEFPIKFD